MWGHRFGAVAWRLRLAALLGQAAALGSELHHPSLSFPGFDGLIQSTAVPGLELMLNATQGSYRRNDLGDLLFKMK